MLENYIELIKMIDNSFDGIMVVDENLKIRYCKYFSASGLGSVDVKTAIGKTPLDIFTNITEETSTFYRALKYGEACLNNTQVILYSNGKKEPIVDSTIPIILNDKIIGAVNTVRFVSNFKKNNFTNHSNIIAPCFNDLYTINDIIGTSDEILSLKNKISKVSKTDSNVFIYGETGTGKEMVAQSIHSNSDRKNKIFISQNCAAIPDNLLESILFGTTKGSYTDAINRPGIFEMAHGGTIFLDEINSMNLNMQAKLLRIIEDKKITRIGGIETKEVDVRIIAAINEAPETCLAEKRIRPDLFYRLSSVQIKTPSLAERNEDIENLAQFLIEFYHTKMNKDLKDISKDVFKIFYNYTWP
ncbi:sigma-54 interaction domain-containing protein [Fusobacterium varium]